MIKKLLNINYKGRKNKPKRLTALGKLTDKSVLEDTAEPWQRYEAERLKRHKRMLATYRLLLIFTVFFAIFVIGARLMLRFGWGQTWNIGWNFSNFKLGDIWGAEGSYVQDNFEGRPLASLVGQAFSPQSNWGEARRLVGSNENLDVLYFKQIKIYFVVDRKAKQIIYASREHP